MVAAWLGYANGLHAPGRRDERRRVGRRPPSVARTRVRGPGHPSGRDDAPVGIGLNLYPCEPATDEPEDGRAATLADEQLNRLYLDPVFGRGYPRGPPGASRALGDAIRDGDLDHIAWPLSCSGVNYYTVKTISASMPARLDPRRSSRTPSAAGRVPAGDGDHRVGLADRPDGLTERSCDLIREYAPPSIFLTENGAACTDVLGPDG